MEIPPPQHALLRLQHLSAIGSCTRQERLHRATIVLLSLITCVAGAAWGVLCTLIGLHHVALIPFGYALIVLACIILFIILQRSNLLAYTQLSLLLILPFIVQWQIGGFMSAGAVMLWSILSPIGALFLFGGRPAILWFGAYLALALASLAYEALFHPPTLPSGSLIDSGGLALGIAVFNVAAVSAATFAIIAYALVNLRREQASVEELLLNILPGPIAEWIKDGESFIADSFEEVTVLFADVVGFTRLAAAYPADNVVSLLNHIFSEFDELIARYEAEKIKTIGDAYMIASGLPVARSDHAHVIAEVALAMREIVEGIASERSLPLKLRLGIHTGPVVAGIIGLRKFAYDIWGDTVNIASRMESTAPSRRNSGERTRPRAPAAALRLRIARSHERPRARRDGELAAQGAEEGGPERALPAPNEPAAPENASQLRSRWSVMRRDHRAA